MPMTDHMFGLVAFEERDERPRYSKGPAAPCRHCGGALRPFSSSDRMMCVRCGGVPGAFDVLTKTYDWKTASAVVPVPIDVRGLAEEMGIDIDDAIEIDE